jgi:uncharacterized protein (DUF2342 family)
MLVQFLPIAWLLTGCAAVAVYVASDIFQRFDPAYPLRPALVLAGLLQIMAAAATVGQGMSKFGHEFRLFMPFHGGAPFVTMQAVGYLSVVAALVSPLVYLLAIVPLLGPIHGPLGAVGSSPPSATPC